ncbi:hypothetical protein BH24ACI3_BH24ACI3_09830 [soil metagenome]
MSTHFRKMGAMIALIWCTLQIFTVAEAQTVTAKMNDVRETEFVISGEFAAAERRNLSFQNSIAGNQDLASRIKDVKLADANGVAVNYSKLADGEYLADRDFRKFAYTIDLTPRTESTAAAHISWIGSESGLLMMADLLPAMGQGIRGSFGLTLSDGWRSGGECSHEGGKIKCEFVDFANGVFPIGRDLRQRRLLMKDGTTLLLAVQGEWLFTDNEATKIVTSIYDSNRESFDSSPASNLAVSIVRFPSPQAAGTWQAETRGTNVTIVSADMAFRTQSLQRLHEQLRHEIFHLWIPNGLSLTGNYDWFYEGFALYQSLRVGVEQNRITFNDMLSTLSNASVIDRQNQGRPLTDDSARRWQGTNTEVYARGMMIAFAADVAIISASKGKESIVDLLAELYRRHKKGSPPAEANAAILSIMAERKELGDLIEHSLKKGAAVDIARIADGAGLHLTGSAGRERLTAIEKPNRSQRRILEKLGYNSWKRTPKYQNAN